MAKQQTDDLVQLTQEAKDRLEKMGAEIEKSENLLADLEDLGQDTSRIRERLQWAKKARETLLKHI